MDPRTYKVMGTDGKWSPSLSESQLFAYACERMIRPTTKIRNEVDGRIYDAVDHPGVRAIFQQGLLFLDSPATVAPLAPFSRRRTIGLTLLGTVAAAFLAASIVVERKQPEVFVPTLPAASAAVAAANDNRFVGNWEASRDNHVVRDEYRKDGTGEERFITPTEDFQSAIFLWRTAGGNNLYVTRASTRSPDAHADTISYTYRFTDKNSLGLVDPTVNMETLQWHRVSNTISKRGNNGR